MIRLLLALLVALPLTVSAERDRYHGRDSGPPNAVEGVLIDRIIAAIDAVVRDAKPLLTIDVLVIRDHREPLPHYRNRSWSDANDHRIKEDGTCANPATPVRIGCARGQYKGSWVAVLSLSPSAVWIDNAVRPELPAMNPCWHGGQWFLAITRHELLHRWYHHRNPAEEAEMLAIERRVSDWLAADEITQNFAQFYDDLKFAGLGCADRRALL